MRREEILSLTAGRELDALVSEALGVPVLGWDYAMAPDGHTQAIFALARQKFGNSPQEKP